MSKDIIKIDQDKCSGCGLCVTACAEGAIGMVGGKAKLLREDYCDGLGNCLPVCPTGAITIAKVEETAPAPQPDLACGCPGSTCQVYEPKTGDSGVFRDQLEITSQLRQWPIQIKLVPVQAAFFQQADLLVAADCTAFAYGDFHNRYIRKHITLIGCPKLDEIDYSEKLTAIIKENDLRSITIVRMEVPCCGGLEKAVKMAISASGKMIPWQVVTISTDGKILE